jgi:hypothetical protein
MSDCNEVRTRKRIQSLLQSALETAALNGALNNVSLTVAIVAYPSMWPASGNFSFVVGTETIVVTAGHGTTSLTVTRASPVSHLTGVVCTLVVSRVKLGSVNLDGNADFFDSLVAIGPYAQILPSEEDEVDFQGHTKYSVTLRMYFGYPKNADNDYVTIENLKGIARAVLFDTTNWTGSEKGNPPEEAGPWGKPDEDADNTVNVSVKFEKTMKFMGTI